MYEIKPISRIESVLACPVVRSICPQINQTYCLTKSNHLQRFKMNTGEYIDTMYLSDTAKFSVLHWMQVAETFYVQHADKNKDIECILFHCDPFYIIAKLTLSKKLFGNITSVNFEGDVVMLEERKNFRFHRLSDILENNVALPTDWAHTATLPIPVTCQITRIPKILFEIKADQIDFGGFPHRGIAQHKVGEKMNFEIFSLENWNSITLVNHRNMYVLFHDKWRIMIKTDDYIEQCIVDKETGDLKSLFKLEYLPPKEDRHQVTRSGRTVKTRLDDRDPIRSFDVDDESDSIAILQSGTVRVYNNNNGDLIRSFELQDYNEEDNHVIRLDGMYLIWIFQREGLFTVRTFRLVHDVQTNDKKKNINSDEEYWISPVSSDNDDDFGAIDEVE
jgi:hypothetical protein